MIKAHKTAKKQRDIYKTKSRRMIQKDVTINDIDITDIEII